MLKDYWPTPAMYETRFVVRKGKIIKTIKTLRV